MLHIRRLALLRFNDGIRADGLRASVLWPPSQPRITIQESFLQQSRPFIHTWESIHVLHVWLSQTSCLQCVLKGNSADFYAHNVFICLVEYYSDRKFCCSRKTWSLKTAWSDGWDLQVWTCVCVWRWAPETSVSRCSLLIKVSIMSHNTLVVTLHCG